MHKRATKGGSGRNPALDHARRANMLLALHRLMTPDTYKASKYSYKDKKHITTAVTSGLRCQRALTSLASRLRGGISNVVDAEAETKPTTAQSTGQVPGSATWDAMVRLSDASTPIPGSAAAGGEEAKDDWQHRVVTGEYGIRPRASTILKAARVWYGCGQGNNVASSACSEPKCPRRWRGGPRRLENLRISCSRFKHGVPPRASSGKGFFTGGDVKNATRGGDTPRAWAVGEGSGENVEIFTNPDARRQGLSGDGDVTLGKLLYFFDHVGNPRRSGSTERGPLMHYALVYEYVTCGRGRTKREDPATKHPTYWLQGGIRAEPSVFPVEAIRRTVHMYHLCPASSLAGDLGRGASSAANRCCGLVDGKATRGGGGKVWKHRYVLATARQPETQRDAYMLNEHWRGVYQDGVV